MAEGQIGPEIANMGPASTPGAAEKRTSEVVGPLQAPVNEVLSGMPESKDGQPVVPGREIPPAHVAEAAGLQSDNLSKAQLEAALDHLAGQKAKGE